MQIETQRLRLRPYYDSDLEAVVKLANNWAVAKWLFNLPYPYEETHAREWIDIVRKRHEDGNPVSFAFALRENDQFIGGGGLDGNMGDGVERVELGYWLGEPYHGHGYAKEAVAALIKCGFMTLGLECITAHTDPENVKSQKVLAGCALKPDGNLKLHHPNRSGVTYASSFKTLRAEFGLP